MADTTWTAPACQRTHGWEDAIETLHRIVSQDGDAVAWICPELGGNTVAYAVLVDHRGVGPGLRHGARLPLRDAVTVRPSDPVSVPRGHARRHLPVARSGIPRPADLPRRLGRGHPQGFRPYSPWQFWENSSDRALLVFSTPESLDPDRAASYPFQVRLTHEISLGAGWPHLDAGGREPGHGVGAAGVRPAPLLRDGHTG